MANPYHIGLIGGIGPAATIAYYKGLTSEMRARQAPLELTIVNADVDTLVRNTLADNREAQAGVYLGLLDRLKAAGADCAAITSLGGHFCFDETARASPLPLVSAVAPLDAYFQNEGLKTVGLLGTEVVMRTRFYNLLKLTRSVAPLDNMQQIGDTYREMAIRGFCFETERALFLEEGRRMIEDQGADAVILAGTDLGLAFEGQNVGYRVVDALDVHVALLADLASGAGTLN
ncbi:MAG: aspartate/glutamate racemase family protein [Pseudomonadota bacterium]